MVHQDRLENLVQKDQRVNQARHRNTLGTKRNLQAAAAVVVVVVAVILQAVPAVTQKRKRAFLKGSQRSMLELRCRPDQRILPPKATNLLIPSHKLTTQDRRLFRHNKTVNHNRKDRNRLQVLSLNRAVLRLPEASQPHPHFQFFGNREIIMSLLVVFIYMLRSFILIVANADKNVLLLIYNTSNRSRNKRRR